MILLSASYVTRGQNGIELPVDEFSARVTSEKEPQILDVRTQGEFRKGFIAGAVNSDINSGNFKSHVSTLDKSKPVFVYCLSGGRSKKAAAYLRRSGFGEVYELKGGMMAWNGAKKPVIKLEESAEGMSVDTFRSKIETGNLILVDFYARWCAPCRKMAPSLEALKQEYSGRMTLLKIDADANRILVDELAVQVLPTLYLYKDGKKVWTHTGYLTREEIEQKVKDNL